MASTSGWRRWLAEVGQRASPLGLAACYALLAAACLLPNPASPAGLVLCGLLYAAASYGVYRLSAGWRQAVAARDGDARINKLYSALYQCNQSAMRSHSQEQLFGEVCRHAVDHAGVAMAWIGVVDDDGHSLRPVAWHGRHVDYLDGLVISVAPDSRFAQGPTGQAVIHDRPVWCQHFADDAATAAWRQHAAKAGWAASAALPLHRDGRVYGALSIYAQRPQAFDEASRGLLMEMAANLDFAIAKFASEAARQHAERQLSASRQYLRAVIDNEPECVKIVDRQGRVLDINKAGLAIVEADSIGQIQDLDLAECVLPAYREAYRALHERALAGQEGHLEFECVCLKGTRRWLETHSTLLPGEPAVLSITRDISARKQAEAKLRLAGQVFAQSREGFVVTDADKKIVMVNQAFTTVTGYAPEEALGKDPGELLRSELQDGHFYAAMWDAIHSQGFWQGEIWNRRKDGGVYPEWLNISTVVGDDGSIHYVGIFTDLSQLKAYEQKLEFLAHHDPLTQLPNRALLSYRIQLAINRARRERRQLAVMMLDLDRFKHINDSFGHPAGDELLQQVATRLSALLRKTDTVARLGGDEFTILLEDMVEAEVAGKVAGLVIADLSRPFTLSHHGDVKIGASVGISMFPTHGKTPEALMQQADSALYLAKAQGRGRYAYFSHDLTVAAQKRMALETQLRKAVEMGELVLFFQPQVDIASNRIVGAEALLRWRNPAGGLVLPASFIPIAEESGLILPMGEWALREACRQGRRWLDLGLPAIVLAVNVSPYQLMHQDLEALVTAVLAETGFPAERLELELTETALMRHQDKCLEVLRSLRLKGVSFAIDDFGTGYSSLAYLKRFPLDVLKIDKSFIEEIPGNGDDMEIAAAIVAIAETLGFKVVAEGVETVEQLAFLSSKGCDLYQGYLKSKPVTAEAFATLLLEQQARPGPVPPSGLPVRVVHS